APHLLVFAERHAQRFDAVLVRALAQKLDRLLARAGSEALALDPLVHRSEAHLVLGQPSFALVVHVRIPSSSGTAEERVPRRRRLQPWSRTTFGSTCGFPP